MSRRANQPDTQTDIDLRECICATPPKSFIMVAGAGSGKTTSLIKALKAIIESHGETLRLRRQRVACITYTELAAGEIWSDVGNNPLVHVSTIHSFMWLLIRPFQADIKFWVAGRIEEKLQELRDTATNFGPRVQQRTRDKTQRDIVRYEQQRARVEQVSSFKYETGSDYAKGILGHDDIIRMVPQLLLARPLLRTLLAQQFPFLFVDESQDTTENVVEALKAVDHQLGANFCLGFFGDPMQRIYLTGVGVIPLEDGWKYITKPENFRCPTTVLAVANSIRRPIGDLVQVRGRMIERRNIKRELLRYSCLNQKAPAVFAYLYHKNLRGYSPLFEYPPAFHHRAYRAWLCIFVPSSTTPGTAKSSDIHFNIRVFCVKQFSGS